MVLVLKYDVLKYNIVPIVKMQVEDILVAAIMIVKLKSSFGNKNFCHCRNAKKKRIALHR